MKIYYVESYDFVGWFPHKSKAIDKARDIVQSARDGMRNDLVEVTEHTLPRITKAFICEMIASDGAGISEDARIIRRWSLTRGLLD